MKMIVGLGNPGKEYAQTRHNIGFLVLDKISQSPEILSVGETQLQLLPTNITKAEVAKTALDGEKLLFVKPRTFMNNSGEAVAKLSQYYKIDPIDIMVITDDLDLPIGTIRIRKEGTSGGHNGLDSIIKSLNTDQFTRVRVGIGRPEDPNDLEAKEFVLSGFNVREKAEIKEVIERTANIIVVGLKNPQGLEAHTSEAK